MLMRMFKNFHKDNRGFTLVELMVVVVIIGVLTAIAVPVYKASTEKAEAGACAANLRMIASAIQQYKMNSDDGKTLPTEMSNLKEYFLEEPECPSGGTYTIVGEHAKCSLDDEGVDGHNYRNSESSGDGGSSGGGGDGGDGEE